MKKYGIFLGLCALCAHHTWCKDVGSLGIMDRVWFDAHAKDKAVKLAIATMLITLLDEKNEFSAPIQEYIEKYHALFAKKFGQSLEEVDFSTLPAFKNLTTQCDQQKITLTQQATLKETLCNATISTIQTQLQQKQTEYTTLQEKKNRLLASLVTLQKTEEELEKAQQQYDLELTSNTLTPTTKALLRSTFAAYQKAVTDIATVTEQLGGKLNLGQQELIQLAQWRVVDLEK